MTKEERVKKQIEFWDKNNKSISDIYHPKIPIMDKDLYHKHVVPGLIRMGAIPKENLEIGKFYKGYCRNSDRAVWLGDKFEYDRVKFGHRFKEKINHFEDDNGYDLFVPYKQLN